MIQTTLLMARVVAGNTNSGLRHDRRFESFSSFRDLKFRFRVPVHEAADDTKLSIQVSVANSVLKSQCCR
jgi:hypothetical protein